MFAEKDDRLIELVGPLDITSARVILQVLCGTIQGSDGFPPNFCADELIVFHVVIVR